MIFIQWCGQKNDPHNHVQVDALLATWGAEMISKVAELRKTRRLVQEFRMNRSTREEAQQTQVIYRLMSPSFPLDLLLPVVKAIVQRHACYWSATGRHKLGIRTGRIFPSTDSVVKTGRSLLQQLAEEYLLKLCIIKTPAFFTSEHAFEIPPALESKGHNVRRLVLDLRTTPFDGGYNRELNNGSKSMESLARAFPRLSVCVCLLHLKNVGQHGRGSFNSQILRFQSAREWDDLCDGWEYVDFEDTILDFMMAFARSGPGKRKLIRFSTNEQVVDANGECCEAGIGRLVSLSSLVASIDTENAEGASSSDPEQDADREHPSMAHARRIFDQAYWGPRGLRRVNQPSIATS
jgi:hypothetical protein